MKRSIPLLVAGLLLGAGVFAGNGHRIISEELKKAFSERFPKAEQVKWEEQSNEVTVGFMNEGVSTRAEYDKNGVLLSTTRYYADEQMLPAKMDRKLHKKFPGFTVYGVTERTTDDGTEFYIKMQDAGHWLTVKSDSGGGDMYASEKLDKTN